MEKTVAPTLGSLVGDLLGFGAGFAAMLLEAQDVDRVRAAATAGAVRLWHEGADPDLAADHYGIPRAALDDAIRWRLRAPRRRR